MSRSKQGFFKVFRDARRQFRWSLYASNGRILAVSGEGYKTLKSCLKGLEGVQSAGNWRVEVESSSTACKVRSQNV